MQTSNVRGTHRGCLKLKNISMGLLAVAAIAGISGSKAMADQVIVNGGYHAQITDHWCGSASLEMMLDVPTVRGANGAVNSLLNATDGGTIPSGFGDPSPVINNVTHQVTFGAQSFLYGLNHGTNFAFSGANQQSYFNPSWKVGSGTDTPGVVADLNILDSTTSQQALGFGNHNYQGYSLAPTLTGGALASRTIANALADFNIPAVTAVESGAHYITTFGVSTTAAPGNGNNYNINGFYIHDPWTGYAYSQALARNFQPASASWGLGWNTYLRYGVDLDPVNGRNITLPNGNVVKGRLAPWFQIFNPSPAQPGAGPAFANPGVAFVVDPQGPESIDTGNLASDDSIGNGLSVIPTISSGTADTDAINDLSADPTLSTEPGLKNGSFDSSNEIFMPQPGDTTGEGDWLVPYDTGGSVTGAVMIDAATGIIDEATWIDPTADGVTSIPLAELDQMFIDQSTGQYPNNNAVPEPASMSLLLLGSAGLLGRRRR